MQCYLKRKYIKSRTFNDKNLWIIKKNMVHKKLLPHLALTLTPQGIGGAMKRDVSKQWCTLQWCASRGWVIGPLCHRSPMNSLHKDQWRGALIFSFNCAWINGWVNSRQAGDSKGHRAHYDVTVMLKHTRLYARYWDVPSIYSKLCGNIEGILPKRPYRSCLRKAGRALLTGYPRYPVSPMTSSGTGDTTCGAVSTMLKWMINDFSFTVRENTKYTFIERHVSLRYSWPSPVGLGLLIANCRSVGRNSYWPDSDMVHLEWITLAKVTVKYPCCVEHIHLHIQISW